MQITTGKVVSIDYKLTDDKQNTIDSSEGKDPLTYLHGVGQLIPGLEKALEGKTTDENLKVKIPAAEGYGERDEAKIMVIPRENIQGVGELKVGMQLSSGDEHSHQSVTVTKIDGDKVTIDANHPLAGQNLNFDVTIRNIREATKEEQEHGHVHGPGGHHH